MPPKRAAKGKGKRQVSDSGDADEQSSSGEEEVPKRQAKPAAKRPRGASKVAASRQDIISHEALAARLPRSALESLFVRVLNGEAVGRPEVEAFLAGSQVAVAHGPVASDERLVTDGPFAALGRDLTIKIFSLLSLHDRLVCVGETCRGWRSLRSDPALWHSLELSCEHLGRGSLRRARAEITFTDPSLRAFLFSARSPLLASYGAVRDLTIHGGTKDCGTSTFKAIFKAFTGVTRLTLSGRKITPPALSDLAKILGGRLVSLNLSRLATAVGPDALLSLLAACPRLEHLSLPGGDSAADSPGFLRALGQRVAAARSGGGAAGGGAAGDGSSAGAASLLRELTVGDPNGQPDVTCGGWLSGSALPTLGGAFPELETLRLFGLQSTAQPFELHGSWLWGDHFLSDGPDPRDRKRPDVAALKKAWAPLPRLEAIEIKQIDRGYLQVGLYAKPGPPVPLRALPKASEGVAAILSLPSLEELHLAFIAVDREDCVLASVPRLEMLTLEYCGAGSASAAVAVARGAPRLRSLCLRSVSLRDEGGSEGDGLAGLLDGTTAVKAEKKPPAAAARGGGKKKTQLAEEEEEEKEEDAAAAAGGGEDPPPLRGLTVLSIEYSTKWRSPGDQFCDTLMHRAEGGRAAPDPPETVASVLLELARRRCCPCLRSLRLQAPPESRAHSSDRVCSLPAAFEEEAPWPELRALEVSGVSGAAVGAAVGSLRAPKLETLVLLPVVRAGGGVDASARAVSAAAAAAVAAAGAGGPKQQQQQQQASGGRPSSGGASAAAAPLSPEEILYQKIRERSPLLPELVLLAEHEKGAGGPDEEDDGEGDGGAAGPAAGGGGAGSTPMETDDEHHGQHHGRQVVLMMRSSLLAAVAIACGRRRGREESTAPEPSSRCEPERGARAFVKVCPARKKASTSTTWPRHKSDASRDA